MRRAFATTRRIVEQLKHDRRSLAMIVAVPSVLMVVFSYVFDGQPRVFERIGPLMIGLFGFIIMFLITSVTMVRERTSGTLERLLTTPLRRGEFIGGYALAFAFAGFVQALVTVAVAQWLLDVGLQQPWAALLFAVVGSVVGTALGLLTSAFARTEFQAVQFMPLIIIPQILVCGLLVPREHMPEALQVFARALPLTYSTDALTTLTTSNSWTTGLTVDLLVLVGFAFGSLVLASLTLRRRTA
jgi:ABC-2 type transport system permease protein